MSTAERRVAIATALTLYLAFVAYQSLAGGAPRPCAAPLLLSNPNFSRSDALANVVAYIPLGLLVAALASSRPSLAWRWIGWLGICAFSLAMEIVQACLSARVSSWFDWSMNSLGAWLGVLALPLIGRAWPLVGVAFVPRRGAGPMAGPTLLFIGAWLAVSTFPWRFTFDVSTVRANLAFLKGIGTSATLDPWSVAQHAFGWLAVGAAARAINPDRRSASRWLFVLLSASLGAQALLTQRSLSYAELSGVAAAALACRFWWPRMRDAWLARLLPGFALLAVAAYELAPGRGASMYAPFSWWPLIGQGSLLAALQLTLFFSWLAFAVVLSLRWAAHETRLAQAASGRSDRHGAIATRFGWPVVMVFALFSMEIAQSWIPGRTGDTSPPLIAALAFIVAWVLTDRIKAPDRATLRRFVG